VRAAGPRPAVPGRAASERAVGLRAWTDALLGQRARILVKSSC
jgi:hypothetical protein